MTPARNDMRATRSIDNYLFSGVSVFDVLTRLKARMPEAVDGVDLTQEKLDKELNARVDDIEKHLVTLRNDFVQLETTVRPLAKQLIEARKDRLLGAKKMAASLSFPLKPRDGAKSYYVPTVRK